MEKPSIMPFQDLRGTFPMDFPLYMDPYYFHAPLGDGDLGIGQLRETDRPIRRQGSIRHLSLYLRVRTPAQRRLGVMHATPFIRDRA
jgi:hypothetical protein